MLKSITTKYCAGAIAAAAILIGAPKADAALVGNVFIDGGGANLLGSQGGANPIFNFATTISGITFQGGASSNDPGTATLATLFDSAVQINNTTGVQHTLRFVFTDNTFTAPTGPVTANSHAAGTSPAGGSLVRLDLFSSQVAATNIVHVLGAPENTNFVNNSYNNDRTVGTVIPGGAFTIGQDYTFTVGAVTSFNFSNSLSIAAVPAVPEPGNFIAGASVLALIGGSQLLSRKRNRQAAC